MRARRGEAGPSRAPFALACALAALGASACHHSEPPPSESTVDPVSAAAAGASDDAGDPNGGVGAADAGRPVLAARCHAAAIALAIDGGSDDLSIGDAVPYPGGYAVGLVRRSSAGRVAAVALVDASGVGGKVLDLGPTLGDAPPPRLAWRPSGLVAAAYLRAAGPNDARAMGIYTLAVDAVPGAPAATAPGTPSSGTPASGSPAPLSIPQQRDDSLAFDLAASGVGAGDGLLVWDEAGGAARGVIRAVGITKSSVGAASGPASGAAPAVAPAPASGSASAAAPAPGGVAASAGSPAPAPSPFVVHDVSPPDSDAELPRVVHLGWPGAEFAVLWIARHAESPLALDASYATESPASAGLEATGEARAYGWLEMIAVDARGVPAGPARRLTAASGHVSTYDVEVAGGGAAPGGAPAQPVLLVVARDDGEAIDGSGGALLRVRVRSAGGTSGAGGLAAALVEAPVALTTDGLGRGGPSFVPGSDGPSSPASASPASPPGVAGPDAGEPLLAPLALAWVGPGEQGRLLPLDAAGSPTAAPSAEDALNDARPLLFLGGRPDVAAGGRRGAVLVATPGDPVAQLRVFACLR